MPNPARILRLAAMLAATSTLVGCVSQERYDDTETSARGLQARNQELLQENQSLEAMLAQKNSEIANLQSDKALLTDRLDGVSSNMTTLRGDYSELDSRLRNLGIGLNPATDRALRQLAQQHPSLISYDANLGMVRFGSDLTFASGSDEVKAEAREGLSQLARILQTSDAGEYDIRVVGHTDSQKPGKSRDRFPTNRHLSVARAIAVGNALESAGVPGSRIEVVGWGPHRPTVPNNDRGGTAPNRRVEIFFVPSSESEFGSGQDYQPVPSDARSVDANETQPEYPVK